MNEEDVEFAEEYVEYIKLLKENGEDVGVFSKIVDNRVHGLMNKNELTDDERDIIADQIIDDYLDKSSGR